MATRPISAMYVNVQVRPRRWLKRSVSAAAWLTARIDRVSPRAADLVASAVIFLCIKFGYVITVRR